MNGLIPLAFLLIVTLFVGLVVWLALLGGGSAYDDGARDGHNNSHAMDYRIGLNKLAYDIGWGAHERERRREERRTERAKRRTEIARERVQRRSSGGGAV